MNQFCYGDNLKVLSKVPDKVTDLVHLAPPSIFARSRNLVFKKHKDYDGPSQVMGFEDISQRSHKPYHEFKSDEHNQSVCKLVDSVSYIIRLAGLKTEIAASRGQAIPRSTKEPDNRSRMLA